jgi:ElaB/YqjD/DUF883 family membrane-anchored ribosome-binding protein
MSGSATPPDNRSSAEIEREVENTRARLTGTLEQLRDRATPGQLFEQVLDYAKQSGGTDFARNLAASVRDHPLPLLLIGAGIGWLMLSDRRGGGTSSDAGHRQRALPPPSARDYPGSVRVYPTGSQTAASDTGGPSATERASAAVSEAKDRVSEAAGSLRDSVSGAADRAGEAATSAYRSVADAASSGSEGIGSGASSAAQAVADAGRGARDQLGQLGDGASRGLGWLVREQPLVLGAIGLAVGAAVGALLPGTETEDRLMGESRDDLAERARATAEEGLERAKGIPGEQLDEAKDRLDRSGLSVDRAADALSETARGVREAVGDVARGVAEQAKTALGSGDEAAGPPSGRAAPPREPDAPAANTDPSPRTRPAPV